MRDPRNEGSGRRLDLSQNFLADAGRAAAYARLISDVFGYAPARPPDPDPAWEAFAFFVPDGACVAGVEVGRLPLVLDGVAGAAMALRLAGVASSHRGRGLFRDLMDATLALCDARADAVPMLLYTEDPGLYTRFGFVPLAQHAFVGAAPLVARRTPARPLDRAAATTLIERFAPLRAPVSLQCAVRGAGDLMKANLDDDDLRFAFLERFEALMIYEMDEKELVIVDIVAANIPTMVDIVTALAVGTRRVRTLFPPDRLDWEAVPERDDTGLMIRGSVPSAMRRPFMLPPTNSF